MTNYLIIRRSYSTQEKIYRIQKNKTSKYNILVREIIFHLHIKNLYEINIMDFLTFKQGALKMI